MVFNEEHFNYRCLAVRSRIVNGVEQEYEQEFSDIQMAYLWCIEDAHIQAPNFPNGRPNVIEVGNWEVCSFGFTVDVLNMNHRREQDFGITCLSAPDIEYTLYYI